MFCVKILLGDQLLVVAGRRAAVVTVGCCQARYWLYRLPPPGFQRRPNRNRVVNILFLSITLLIQTQLSGNTQRARV